LSCPVGFKNGTDGNVRIAVDALKAARTPHHFLSVTKEGHSAIVSTNGNEDCHIILRGGKHPNYDAASVDAAARELAASGLEQRLMVDCSHSNSQKMYQRQIDVAREVARQVAAGEDRVIGVMVESHLKAGRQDLVPGSRSVGAEHHRRLHRLEDSVPLLKNLARPCASAGWSKPKNPSSNRGQTTFFIEPRKAAIRDRAINRSVPGFLGRRWPDTRVQAVAVRSLSFTGDEAYFVDWGDFPIPATTIIRR
jgi:hypothetical protein